MEVQRREKIKIALGSMLEHKLSHAFHLWVKHTSHKCNDDLKLKFSKLNEDLHEKYQEEKAKRIKQGEVYRNGL